MQGKVNTEVAPIATGKHMILPSAGRITGTDMGHRKDDNAMGKLGGLAINLDTAARPRVCPVQSAQPMAFTAPFGTVIPNAERKRFPVGWI